MGMFGFLHIPYYLAPTLKSGVAIAPSPALRLWKHTFGDSLSVFDKFLMLPVWKCYVHSFKPKDLHGITILPVKPIEEIN